MKLRKTEKKYILDSTGVKLISGDVNQWLRRVGVKRENIIRMRLTMEELLMNISEHFGGAAEGSLSSGRRFGSPYLLFKYEGESYNPMSLDRASDVEWTQALLANIGLVPVWHYRHGVNYLMLRAPRETLRSETLLVIAALLAAAMGLLRGVIPEQITRSIIDHALTPVSDAFMNVLNTFVGLMVLLSVVSGICSIGSLSDFSKMGRYVLLRLVGMTFLGTGVSVAAMLPFFRFGEGAAQSGSSQLGALIDLLFDIFPSDPVTPFIQGNMLQIIFIAVMTGCALLVLDSQTDGIKTLVNQLNILLLQIVQSVCVMLPLYIFASLLAMLWQNGAGVFISLWKPVVIHAAFIILFLAAKLIVVCGRLGLSPAAVLGKMKGTMLIGLATSSSSAAFGDMVDVNEHRLGIAPELDGVGLPFANLLVGSPHGALMVVVLYYLSEYYSVPISAVWLLTVWVMCSILCMTVPPVSGGMLAVIGILMSQTGIPSEGLAVAGLISIIADFGATAIKIGITHLELLRQAEHLDLLDRSVLGGN